VRLGAREESQGLVERGQRLAPVAQHHEISDLNAVALGQRRGAQDLIDGDLLVDVVEHRL
jgi:hypothetical protein